MNWLDLPSLSTLRAFCAYAETGSLAKAGASLNVSHAAVSQQLRALEAHLGVELLDRGGRALELTAAGHHLARALQLGFGAIETAVQELSRAGSSRPLHITCTPTFAAHWLMPRLAGFQQEYADIDLVVDPVGTVSELKPGGIDLALRYGGGNWPGLQSELFLSSPMVVIAAPDLLADRRVHAPEELLDFPWLEELGTTEAAFWLRSRGVTQAQRGARVTLPGNLLLEAVRAGQGVAVSVREFVKEDLRVGRLVELFTEQDGRGYHIVTRPGVQRPEARRFISWLRKQ